VRKRAQVILRSGDWTRAAEASHRRARPTRSTGEATLLGWHGNSKGGAGARHPACLPACAGCGSNEEPPRL